MNSELDECDSTLPELIEAATRRPSEFIIQNS